VQRFFIDRAGAENMARAAKMEAARRFRPKAVAERHLEIYRELLGRR